MPNATLTSPDLAVGEQVQMEVVNGSGVKFIVVFGGSGGSTGGLTTVANAAALTAVDVSGFPDGAQAFVDSYGALFALSPTQALEPDVVLAASDGRTWVRILTAVGPAAAAQATWFFNPASGNNESDGLTSGTALKTWSEMIRRLGTSSPALRQNTTWTFLSSQTDNTDPIDFTPRGQNGAIMLLQGVPSVVATVTLSGVVAKNRATPQLLEANLGASAVAKSLLFNETHPSRAWAYANVSGTTWSVTQPLQPATVPPTYALAPPLVDTWTSGDTVQILALPAINVVTLRPAAAEEYNALATVNVALFCYQLDFAGFGTNPTLQAIDANWNVEFIECSLRKAFTANGSANPAEQFPHINVAWGNVFAGRNSTLDGQFGTLAGSFGAFGAFSSLYADGDVILPSTSLVVDATLSQIGLAYLPAGLTAFIQGPTEFTTLSYGQSIVWGPGTLNFQRSARADYIGGSAVATFLNTGGLQLNGSATGQSYTTSGGTGTWKGPIALTPANLDLATGSGGFGGTAINPGGACLTNGSQ